MCVLYESNVGMVLAYLCIHAISMPTSPYKLLGAPYWRLQFICITMRLSAHCVYPVKKLIILVIFVCYAPNLSIICRLYYMCTGQDMICRQIRTFPYMTSMRLLCNKCVCSQITYLNICTTAFTDIYAYMGRFDAFLCVFLGNCLNNTSLGL